MSKSTYPSKLNPIPMSGDQVEQKVVQPVAKPEPAEPVTAKVVLVPAVPEKTEPVKTPKVQKATVKKDDQTESGLKIGTYTISTRPNSGYRILYSVVSKEGKFEKSEKALEELDPQDKSSATAVLKELFVPISIVESRMRENPMWVQHCEMKLQALKTRAAGGDQAAQKTLENTSRIKEGEWRGNIREMISTCNGSSSAKASNKNISKFKNAGLMFRQFPKRPSKEIPSMVAIFPAKFADKVKVAIKTVYNVDEEDKG